MNYPVRTVRARTHATVAAVLLSFFVFRVVAQIIQFLAPTPLLPPFEAWHSGTLPFGVLAAIQAAIIIGCAVQIVRLWLGRARRNPKFGRVLLVVGVVYFLAAVFRLFAGLTFFSEVPFFRASLPAFFHIVLAGLILVFADYNSRSG